MTRVATLAQHQRNLAHILDAQKRLNLGQLQISSGKKSEQYSGVAADARRIVNIETSHIRTSQFISNNKLIDQRLQTMETSVAQIFQVATEYKTLVINALNADNSQDLAMPLQTQSLLDEVSALLNVEQDGRYLFAGTRTNVRPVDQAGLPLIYAIPTADGDSIGYYAGDTTSLTVQADENFAVAYGAHAGQTGFEQAIRAMHMVVVGPPNDRATLDEALRVIDQAIDEISDIRTQIGASRKALENVNQRLDDFLLFSEQTISELENADVTKIITTMNSDQVAVEASFAVISSLSDLSLTRYLR
jgi:flagellar hook-associated protein 3 FlgL